MSGRRREGLAPNLFPFLAVLICTLGTLILLLALVAQNAGEAVAASTPPARSAEEEAKLRQMLEADAEIDRRLSEASWRREQVVRIRDEQTAEIDERRTRQALLEDHAARLREELKRLEAEIEAAHDASEKTEVPQDAIDAIKAKIEDEKAKIEALKSDRQNKTPRIVIVPHKGPNGTDRRPIYIECRANGVYLQPGNVAIDPKYLDNDIPGPNPLDAALKIIRLYAMKNYGDVDAPYPLIVVRPDGIETYGAARLAMKGWDDQYGYELVPDEVKLAYPEPDPLMNEQVDRAIAQAVREQQAYALAIGGRGRGTRGGGGYGDSASGGFAGSGANAPSDSTTTETGSSARSPVSRRAADLPILSARNMDAEMAASLESGRFGSGTSRTGRSQLASQRAASEASSQAAAMEAQIAAEATSLGETKSGSPQGSDAVLGSAAGSSEATANGEVVGSGKLDAKQAPSYAGLGDEDSQADNSPSTADRFAPPSDVASKSNQPSATTDPNAPLGGSMASGATSDQNPAGGEPPPADPNLPEMEPPKGAPTPTVNMQMNGQPPPKELVKRAGKNWALPPDVAAMVGTSMVRTIRVECYEDRLVLLPEGGKGATHIYGFSDGDIARASLELATAVRDRVQRWGAAMPGGRWQPLLEVNVVPGGEVRFQQLLRLMAGSGVDIQAKGAPP